jgi:predicted trehalose synthase
MLLSVAEAGATALDRVAADSTEAFDALQRFADDWEQLARRTFLASYRKAMRGHASLPRHARTINALLMLFMAEKTIGRVTRGLEEHSASVGRGMRQLVRLVQRK